MAITNLPTKTDGTSPGELGRAVINRPRPMGPDLRYDVPAEVYERFKDQVILNSETIGRSVAPAPGTLEARLAALEAAPSGDANLIWAWNGVDLSQFRNGATPELDGTGGALASIESFRGRPVLRFTGGGSFAFAQWAIDPSEFPAGIPARYRLEVTYEQFDDGAGVKTPIGLECGPSLFCRYDGPGDVTALNMCQAANGNSLLQVWARGATMSNAGSTLTGANPGATTTRQSVQRFDVVQQVGAAYSLFYASTFRKPNVESTRFEDADGGNIDLDGTRFDNVIPNTFGIAYRDNANNPSWCEISQFRVLKHPADRV